MMTAPVRLATVRDLSALLGVHPATVRRLLRRGMIPGRRIGQRWYVPSSFVEELTRHQGAREQQERRDDELESQR